MVKDLKEQQPIIDLLTFPTSTDLVESMMGDKGKTADVSKQYHKQQQQQQQQQQHFHNNNNNSNKVDAHKKKSTQRVSPLHEPPKATPVLKEKTRASNSPLLAPKPMKKQKNFGLELKDAKENAEKEVNAKKSLDLTDIGLDSLQVQSKNDLEIGGRSADGLASDEETTDGSTGENIFLGI